MPEDNLKEFLRTVKYDDLCYFPEKAKKLKTVNQLPLNRTYLTLNVNFRKEKVPSEIEMLINDFSFSDKFYLQPLVDLHCSLISILDFDKWIYYIKEQQEIARFLGKLDKAIFKTKYKFCADVLYFDKDNRESITLQIFPEETLLQNLHEFKDKAEIQLDEVFGKNYQKTCWRKNEFKLHDKNTLNRGAMNLIRFNDSNLSQKEADNMLGLIREFNKRAKRRKKPFVPFEGYLSIVQSDHLFDHNTSKVLYPTE